MYELPVSVLMFFSATPMVRLRAITDPASTTMPPIVSDSTQSSITAEPPKLLVIAMVLPSNVQLRTVRSVADHEIELLASSRGTEFQNVQFSTRTVPTPEFAVRIPPAPRNSTSRISTPDVSAIVTPYLN